MQKEQLQKAIVQFDEDDGIEEEKEEELEVSLPYWSVDEDTIPCLTDVWSAGIKAAHDISDKTFDINNNKYTYYHQQGVATMTISLRRGKGEMIKTIGKKDCYMLIHPRAKRIKPRTNPIRSLKLLREYLQMQPL